MPRKKTTSDLIVEELAIEGESRKAQRRAKEFTQRLRKYMLQHVDKPYQEFLRLALAYIRKYAPKVGLYTENIVRDMAYELNVSEIEESSIIKRKAIAAGVTAVAPSYGKLKAATALVATRFLNNVAIKAEELHVDDATNKRITDNIFTNEVTKYLNDVKTQTRTSIKAAESQVKLAAIKDTNDVIGYQWVAVLDNVTSQICQGLNGKKFYFRRSGYKIVPPAHPNCRSSIVPIYENRSNQEELNQAGFEDFKTWARNNPEELRASMGKTRYELYTKGKVRIERFTDVHFEPLNIDDLRRRHTRQFEKANL